MFPGEAALGGGGPEGGLLSMLSSAAAWAGAGVISPAGALFAGADHFFCMATLKAARFRSAAETFGALGFAAKRYAMLAGTLCGSAPTSGFRGAGKTPISSKATMPYFFWKRGRKAKSPSSVQSLESVE